MYESGLKLSFEDMARVYFDNQYTPEQTVYFRDEIVKSLEHEFPFIWSQAKMVWGEEQALYELFRNHAMCNKSLAVALCEPEFGPQFVGNLLSKMSVDNAYV